jgi:hypothetical protein
MQETDGNNPNRMDRRGEFFNFVLLLGGMKRTANRPVKKWIPGQVRNDSSNGTPRAASPTAL